MGLVYTIGAEGGIRTHYLRFTIPLLYQLSYFGAFTTRTIRVRYNSSMKYDFLSLTTPTNLEQEKAKFLANSSYNPIFHYIWQDRPVTYSSSNLLKKRLVDAVLSQNTPEITLAAGSLFKTILDQSTQKQAEAIISARHDNTHSGSASDFARVLQSAFAEFNIPYAVEIVDRGGFNARPSHSNRKVVVSSHIHYEMFSMQGGARHDLAHIMRYLNGKANKIPKSLEYLPTEEGLASYVQDHVKGVEDNGQVQHAIEYLGSIVGVSGSLRDIYNTMRDAGMSHDLAWARASRHKFGFVDTTEPGDIIKPAMYFYHELLVEALSRQEKLRLFVGKISLPELDKYPDYQGLWDPTQLVEFFNL